MPTQNKPSDASQAGKRSKLIELLEWNAMNGEPLRVLCSEIDAEACSRILKANPGERPRLGLQEDIDEGTREAFAKQLLEVSADVIELSTSLQAPDGSEVHPAFYFGSEAAHHPLSLDGTKLGEADLMQLTVAGLRCSGYLGGAAEAMFLRRGRGRDAGGRGTLEVLPGPGAEPAAGAA